MYLAELKNGKSIRQKAEVNFDDSYDIVVAGLGTAGAISAISAAENGASVLGIERINMCGGTATAGGVFGYYYGLPGGKFEEVDSKAKELQNKSFVKGGGFHPDTKGMVLEQMIIENGGAISYDSTVIGVYLGENNETCGVRIITPQGTRNIACKVIIDATGEGEVCAMTGADFKLGRESDGQPQPFSSIRVFMREDDELGLANFDAGYAVPTDAKDLSRGMIQANALHAESHEPLLWITTIPGIREGRLIECDTRLTFSDFNAGITTDKPVAYCYSNFDSHSQDWAFEEDETKDWMVAASLWGKTFVFAIPLETMIVKGFSNLMAVGRCVSVDHIMASAIRMQCGMQKLGQAAGTAAAIAAANDSDIRDIDHEQLASMLKKDKSLDASNLPDCSYPTNPQELKELLKSSKPGEAIWYMSRNINDYEKELVNWLKQTDINLSRHSAMALGIAGRKEALPVLQDIVCERDAFMPESSRSHNHLRIAGALHLLGKIKDEDNIDVVIDFLSNNDDLNIQELSHAVMSLLGLGQAFPEKRESIAQTLEKLMNTKAFDNSKLLLKNSSTTGDDVYESMANLMRLLAAKELKSWNITNSIIDHVDKENLSWREQKLMGEI